MKKNRILCLAAGLSLLFGLSSCYKSVMDPLSGIFPAPTVAEMTTVAVNESAKEEGKRVFTLELNNGSVTLHAALVGDAYYLTSNAYTEAEASAAKKGNFILGRTTVNGVAVQTGTITIAQDGENYKLTSVLFLTDGTPYKISWAGTLHYEPDPEPILLTEVLQAQANTNGTVTVKVGTAGMTVDMMGTPTGDGCALTLDVYSADGYLHAGTYKAAAGETVGEGEFAPGYEYDLSSWGLGIMHWGTCWWVGGEATHITSGTITIEQKGTNWVITWGDESTYPNWAVFTGAIPALTNGGGDGGDEFDGTSLTQFLGSADYTGYGIPLAGVDLGTDGITVTPGDWGNTYGGDGNYLKLEFYSTDGKLAAGTYKACATGGEVGEGEFGIGYDGMFGASGTTWYTMAAGAATPQYVTDGTLTVEVSGDVYTITLKSTVINAQYKGKLSAE